MIDLCNGRLKGKSCPECGQCGSDRRRTWIKEGESRVKDVWFFLKKVRLLSSEISAFSSSNWTFTIVSPESVLDFPSWIGTDLVVAPILRL